MPDYRGVWGWDELREDNLLDVGESADAYKLGFLALVNAQQLVECGGQV